MAIDEFGRFRILAEHYVCVEIGCKSVLRGMDESGERIRLKVKDSRSKG